MPDLASIAAEMTPDQVWSAAFGIGLAIALVIAFLGDRVDGIKW